MMRIVDIIYAIPYILVVIVLLSVLAVRTHRNGYNGFPQNLAVRKSGLNQIFLLFFALGLVSWLTMARVVRGQM